MQTDYSCGQNIKLTEVSINADSALVMNTAPPAPMAVLSEKVVDRIPSPLQGVAERAVAVIGQLSTHEL